MTDKEILDTLQSVQDNIGFDRDRATYSKMLVLLDNMFYYLRSDLQIDYPPYDKTEIKTGEFDF